MKLIILLLMMTMREQKQGYYRYCIIIILLLNTILLEIPQSKLSCTTEEGLDYLDELKSSSFGRFLLKNKGLNGYWTQYVCLWPFSGRITGKNQDGKPATKVEKFFLNKVIIIILNMICLSIS